jgi:hypothetical protein
MKSAKGMGPGEGAARRPGGESVLPKPRASDDDVEGHVLPKPRASDDDVEGHLKRREPAAAGATGLRRRDEKFDPEGRKIRESGDEEDTEGHSTGPRIR